MLRVRDALSASPPVVDDRHLQPWLDMWKRCVHLSTQLGITLPKTQLLLHCILRARWLGNPTLHGTFLDESLNSNLKNALRLCHQHRFEVLGLAKINSLFARDGIRQRTEK